MHFLRTYAIRLIALAGLCTLGALANAQTVPPAIARPAAPATQPYVFGAETNYAPFWVGQSAPNDPGGPAESWSALGPLIFHRPLVARPRFDDGAVVAGGFRPLYVGKRDANGRLIQFHVLYPLFNWRRVKDDGYRWDILTLINHEHGPATRLTKDHSADNQFDIWPIYFSNNTGKPETTYRAVFPIYGDVSHRLLQDRLGWFLFPLYGWSERNGVTTRAVLWPFFRRSTGAGVDGWKIWPLAGYETKPGVYSNTMALWPFFFNNKTFDPDGGQPSQKLAVLPFYYRETAPGLKAESYMLFFGYSDRAIPYRYQETRYFWPLFVQGRGDGHLINRWAPFYTHSIHNEREKRWVMWPLWKHERWSDGINNLDKKQFFYFLYTNFEQKPVNAPAEQPPARKTNVWPLFTYWSDGMGRRQFQALSPFEAFLPQNEPMRLVYTPLFALYKFEQEKPGHTRHTILWNFISYRKEPELREFHVGPLYKGEREGEHKRRALFCGLIGMERKPGQGWRPFVFKFDSIQKKAPMADRQAASVLSPQPAEPAYIQKGPRVRVRR